MAKQTTEITQLTNSLQEAAEMLLYSVENPNPKTEALRREAYETRYGRAPVSEPVYDYRMALIIAEMHQHIASIMTLQAGWLEGKGLVTRTRATNLGATDA